MRNQTCKWVLILLINPQTIDFLICNRSAVFAMLLHMFPKNVATIYAMTEASFSFAEMIGPTLGALMYNVGGFILPFEVCGGLCLLTGELRTAGKLS
jgi:hypothetical protein